MIDVEFFTYAPNGKLIRRISCPESMAEAQLVGGDSIIAAQNGVDVRTHYVDVDSREFIEIPACPSGKYYWFDYDAKEWSRNREWAERDARAKRERLLVESDWTQLPDVPLETKTEWAICRQALRDITDQAGFPFDIDWPVAP